jgi:hypothetical protein
MAVPKPGARFQPLHKFHRARIWADYPQRGRLLEEVARQFAGPGVYVPDVGFEAHGFDPLIK